VTKEKHEIEVLIKDARKNGKKNIEYEDTMINLDEHLVDRYDPIRVR